MSGPKYPNQQLRSVSVEVFFPGKLSALMAMGTIQDRFSAEFPNLFVPNIHPGEAVALRPYQLRPEDGSRSLALAANQATLIAFSYPGFEVFRDEVTTVLDFVLAEVNPKHISRLVYRYENSVGVTRDDEKALPVQGLFPAVISPLAGEEGLRSVDSAFEWNWQQEEYSGVEGVHLRADPAVPGRGETLTFSCYCAVEGTPTAPHSPKDLTKLVEATHKRSCALFERSISAGYRSYISGEEDGES